MSTDPHVAVYPPSDPRGISPAERGVAAEASLNGSADARAFDAALRRMTEEARESGSELCLILAGTDHFKVINDSQGHRIGDQVLRLVAQELRQCVEAIDVVCRCGAEEFAILLPARSYGAALILAESIRAIIEAQVVVTDDGTEIVNVMMSLGLAQYQPGEDCSRLVERAVACLHQSKAFGRNRVTGERDLEGA